MPVAQRRPDRRPGRLDAESNDLLAIGRARPTFQGRLQFAGQFLQGPAPGPASRKNIQRLAAWIQNEFRHRGTMPAGPEMHLACCDGPLDILNLIQACGLDRRPDPLPAARPFLLQQRHVMSSEPLATVKVLTTPVTLSRSRSLPNTVPALRLRLSSRSRMPRIWACSPPSYWAGALGSCISPCSRRPRRPVWEYRNANWS